MWRLLTTIEDWRVGTKRLHPAHPGEILNEEFLKPMSLTQNALARGLGAPPRRINEIVQGKRRVTADTALRLARLFGMSAEFWLGLQMDYELDTESDRLGDRLKNEVKRLREASSQLFREAVVAQPSLIGWVKLNGIRISSTPNETPPFTRRPGEKPVDPGVERDGGRLLPRECHRSNMTRPEADTKRAHRITCAPRLAFLRKTTAHTLDLDDAPRTAAVWATHAAFIG